MTAERATSGGLVFYCDRCSESFDTGERHWGLAWATVSHHGWRARKVDNAWQHICRECAGITAGQTLAPHSFIPAEAVKKMAVLPLPVAPGEKFEVHRLVHEAVVAALRVGAPGLSEPVRSAIASKVAVDVRERLLPKG